MKYIAKLLEYIGINNYAIELEKIYNYSLDLFIIES